jgi:2-polyprenyl-3-methyl-5-hydroxy-6-metoxy-1,4-benzoquinol methylase
VRGGKIPSRRAGTDAAILKAIREFPPCTLLDVGCGEGWLPRILHHEGYTVTGVDSSGSLIEDARKAGGGTFVHASYADLAGTPDLVPGPFGLIVANYSLLGKNIRPLLEAMRSRLVKDGALIVQTLHPDTLPEAEWRTETFAQMGPGFTAAMPYYFRTFSRWSEELAAAGFVLASHREPTHPETARPLSLLMIARVQY